MSLCPVELKKRYRDGRVIPFVGAGASMSVQWKLPTGANARGPSWGELVDQAAKLLGFHSSALARVRGTDLQILEYFKLQHSGQIAPLTNWFVQNVQPPESAIMGSRLHRALAGLTKCRTFYTTNYDSFLEDALRLHGREVRAVAVEAEMGIHSNRCEVVKFHGDLNHPDEIVLTESDYEKRLRLESPLDHRLRADLLGRVVLFLGYSFRDPNVSYLFRLFKDQIGMAKGSLPGTRAYIVVADPSQFEIRLFQDRGLTVIPVGGATIAEETAQVVEEMGGVA